MIKFLSNLIKSKTAESSKRFLALLTFLLLIFIVVGYTTKDNAVQMVTALVSFILALLAVATYENIKTK